MKAEYHEGPEARKKFDTGMTNLFRAPKLAIKDSKKKPDTKPEETSKD